MSNLLRRLFDKSDDRVAVDSCSLSSESPPIGLIAGNGSFPLRFIEGASKSGRPVVVVAHSGETDPDVEKLAHSVTWIKVGQLGKLVSTFLDKQVKEVAMAGGLSRIRAFGVKPDLRGASLLLKLRSAKDDVIMRGVASELEGEGISVVDSTIFLEEYFVPEGVLTKTSPSDDEEKDIEIGAAAIGAMSGQHIGQVVVVKEGVVVAVEAVEGTDRTIERAGKLCGRGSVVVKFAKTNQDMRFDVPIVGVKTIETMIAAKAKVLALEAGRCLILDRDEVISLANKHKISVVGRKQASS